MDVELKKNKRLFANIKQILEAQNIDTSLYSSNDSSIFEDGELDEFNCTEKKIFKALKPVPPPSVLQVDLTSALPLKNKGLKVEKYSPAIKKIFKNQSSLQQQLNEKSPAAKANFSSSNELSTNYFSSHHGSNLQNNPDSLELSKPSPVNDSTKQLRIISENFETPKKHKHNSIKQRITDSFPRKNHPPSVMNTIHEDLDEEEWSDSKRISSPIYSNVGESRIKTGTNVLLNGHRKARLSSPTHQIVKRNRFSSCLETTEIDRTAKKRSSMNVNLGSHFKGPFLYSHQSNRNDNLPKTPTLKELQRKIAMEIELEEQAMKAAKKLEQLQQENDYS